MNILKLCVFQRSIAKKVIKIFLFAEKRRSEERMFKGRKTAHKIAGKR
jgi:hypothetical protein